MSVLFDDKGFPAAIFHRVESPGDDGVGQGPVPVDQGKMPGGVGEFHLLKGFDADGQVGRENVGKLTAAEIALAGIRPVDQLEVGACTVRIPVLKRQAPNADAVDIAPDNAYGAVVLGLNYTVAAVGREIDKMCACSGKTFYGVHFVGGVIVVKPPIIARGIDRAVDKLNGLVDLGLIGCRKTGAGVFAAGCEQKQ